MKTILCLFITIVLLFCHCTDNKIASDSGSGTQTTNGVCIKMNNGCIEGYLFERNQEGIETIQRAEIGMRPQITSIDYKPYNNSGFLKIIDIDSNGSFKFESISNGQFTIEIISVINNKGVVFQDLYVSDTIPFLEKRKMFTSLYTIRGRIIDTTHYDAPYKGVYILGTTTFALTDSLHNFVLQNIPMGHYVVKADYFKKASSLGYARVIGSDIKDSIRIFTDSTRVDFKDTNTIKIDFIL